MKRNASRFGGLMLAALPALMGASGAEADVIISTHATAHMNCTGGTCTPTAANANLNVGDLQTMLLSGGVIVQSTNTAPNIRVASALSWGSSSTLTLKACLSVEVLRAIAVSGSGGLAIVTNNGCGTGGIFTTGHSGHIQFADLSSALSINGESYTLVNDVSTLAADVSVTPGGNYALANTYDAGPDGIYAHAPVTTAFSGKFEGLGNAITHLVLSGGGSPHFALFAQTLPAAVIENVAVIAMHSHGTGYRAMAAGLVAVNAGTIRNAYAAGKMSAPGNFAFTGGLVASNSGTIIASAAYNVPQNGTETGGGLVGFNSGTILQSWAIGKMVSSLAGGLVGENAGTISDSYAVVETAGRFVSPYPGGLVGTNDNTGTIQGAYAAGQVTAASNFGGVAGTNNGALASDYWDIEDTGAGPTFGCGAGSCSGATGLHRAQLQSGLPAGFSASTWTQAPGINNGLPYLIANPPR